MGFLDAVERFFNPQGLPDAITGLDAQMSAESKALTDITVPFDRDWTINNAWQDTDGGIALVNGYSASYAAMYKRQVWVHAVINTLTRGIASLPLKVYRREGDGRVRERQSPLAQLLARPYERGTSFTLIEKMIGDVGIYGNAIAVMSGPRNQAPTGLTPLTPRHMTIDRDGDYVFTDPATGKETGFRRSRVVHLHYYNPDSEQMGVSPLEPLRRSLASEDAAQRLGIASFQNGARPSGILRTDKEIPAERLRAMKSEVVRGFGGVDRTGLPALLTDGLDWKSMSWNMQEAAVTEFRQLHKIEVCAVYRVPPPVVGILEHATFSNIVEQNRMLVGHTFRPWTTLAEETLRAQLIPYFGDPSEWYCEFDFKEMLKASPLDQFAAYGQGINAGWITQNEIRELENMPRMDDADADRLHRPMNLTPVATPETPTGGA